jgi:hypothetical protein
MNYDNTVSVKCPMCGFENKLDKMAQDWYRIKDGDPFVMTCDSENGGCDRFFVARVTLSHNVTTALVDI